jgi:hypothetical protein
MIIVPQQGLFLRSITLNFTVHLYRRGGFVRSSIRSYQSVVTNAMTSTSHVLPLGRAIAEELS